MENFKIDPNISYDVVTLPSQGIYYQNKKKTLRVAYLTAADENILSAPNLLQTDTVIEELLKRKILDKDIDVDDLVVEDRQAILIFLRNTAFGTDFKLKVTDPKTNEVFDADVDLSVLKMKDFDLKPDENGEYAYYMDMSKVNVTFKFLNNQQEKELDKVKSSATGNIVAPTMTKRLEMMIQSINGNRDKLQIYEFIQNLPIKDSQNFKKFVAENKPGLDLIIDITTPSGEVVPIFVDFGVEFFRPFYGL
jgi:hypothetical protein